MHLKYKAQNLNRIKVVFKWKNYVLNYVYLFIKMLKTKIKKNRDCKYNKKNM